MQLGGVNFAIVSQDGSPQLTGSSHTRISPTVGSAVIDADSPGKAIRLINNSDNSLTFSSVVKTKASLVVFVLAD